MARSTQPIPTTRIMPITVRKSAKLEFVFGDAEQLFPRTTAESKQYRELVKQQRLFGEIIEPITECRVSIAVVLHEYNKFFECEVMHDNITVPDTVCMFWVYIGYYWNRKDGVHDFDEMLTDGTEFYLANRQLGESPFILNDYSRDKVMNAITKYLESM